MKYKSEAILREIAGDYILVPTGNTVIDHNGLFSVSEVGARIWQLIPECETPDEISAKISDEYEIDIETAKNDINEFLSRLRELDLIY